MSTPFLGEIHIFAGNFAPSGWLPCDGRLLPIANYTALFSLVGTTYGGDGQTNFALPNLQSRIPFHVGSSMVLGQQAGEENVTLTQQQMAAHTHSLGASSVAATSVTPTNNVPATWGDGQYSSSTPDAALAAAAVSVAGGNEPHNNLPPYVGVTFIIAVTGIYPTQN